jgi:hypothetical protein
VVVSVRTAFDSGRLQALTFAAGNYFCLGTYRTAQQARRSSCRWCCSSGTTCHQRYVLLGVCQPVRRCHRLDGFQRLLERADANDHWQLRHAARG